MYLQKRKKHYFDCGNNQNSALRVFLLVIRPIIITFFGEKVKPFRQKRFDKSHKIHHTHFLNKYLRVFLLVIRNIETPEDQTSRQKL